MLILCYPKYPSQTQNFSNNNLLFHQIVKSPSKKLKINLEQPIAAAPLPNNHTASPFSKRNPEVFDPSGFL